MGAMLLRLHPEQAFYTVMPATPGRWLVVHALPGLPGAFHVDDDCATERAAQESACWLEHERAERLRAQTARWQFANQH